MSDRTPSSTSLGVWPEPLWPISSQGLTSHGLDSHPWRRTVYLLTLAALTSAPYGAAMGSWHGGRLAFYAAVKLPMLLIMTWALVFPFGWMINRVAGASLRTQDLAVASVHPILGASLALLALVPVNLLFTRSFPLPDPSQPQNHNALYVIHVVAVAACGCLATGSLRRLLIKDLGGTGAWLHLGWLMIFALVAGEMGWALRPFIGNPYESVTFLRNDAFDGNVYEFIWTDVLPRLLNK